jgi:hypothetical protein
MGIREGYPRDCLGKWFLGCLDRTKLLRELLGEIMDGWSLVFFSPGSLVTHTNQMIVM